ncbi:MAG: AMP-binding protein [Myxococcales bacterium FL481]|nr:MAG: AMP-binding protein [Myxococcales bacterium FL481]
MTTRSGQFYSWLQAAVRERGSQRSIYTPETTLSRRGLLTRADRRARELAGMGLGAGDVVTISLGNSAEFLVLLMALSKLGAIAMPVDAANGDRVLCEALTRVTTRAVVRRPRGQDSVQIAYPPGYRLVSSRKLPGSMTSIDMLEHADPPAIPAGIELIFGAVAGDTVTRDVLRTGAELKAIGEAAAELLALDADSRLLCVEPLTSPRFFDPVMLGWLASPSQLAMSDGDGLEHALTMARGAERIVVVSSIRGLLDLRRSVTARGETLAITPVMPEATIPIEPLRPLKRCFGVDPIQLLVLEECGLIAARTMARGQRFRPPTNVTVRAGKPLGNGREVLVQTSQRARIAPEPPPGQPGTPVDPQATWLHTGYVGEFVGDQLARVFGREDGLVNIEGRRTCLAGVERRLLQHRRITWAKPRVETSSDGEALLTVEYRATGETEVDDIEEHAIGGLPPFMVPRVFKRLGQS